MMLHCGVTLSTITDMADSREGPIPFRPTDLVKELLLDEQARTGKSRQSIINECISHFLGSPERLKAIAQSGALSPDAIAEIFKLATEAGSKLGANQVDRTKAIAQRAARITRRKPRDK